MSPASQADPLHVDRYIGGYLIANNNNPRQFNKNFANKKNKQHYGPPLPPPPGVYQGGFVAANGLFPQAANFCQNQNNWTGVPLISTANARRNRRPHQNHYQHHSPPFHRQPVQLLNGGSCNLEYGEGHLPLSRLALHTQGAPLILSRRYNNNNNNVVINNRKQNPCQNSYKSSGDVRSTVNSDFVIRKFHETLPKDASFECKKEQISGVVVANSANQNISQVLNLDSLSVTSDESSGSTNSETCLPRIIKPRKRRKKDRKPPTSGGDKNQTSVDSKSEQVDGSSYESVDKNTANVFEGDDKSALDNVKSAEEKRPTDKACEPQPPNSIKNRGHTSHDDVEDDSDDSSSLFEAISRCSPTMCQCKYCDPSGQAWTFDRLCFSSLFASSELKFSSDSLQDKSSPFADKDSALRRSWSEPCPGYSVEKPAMDRVSSPHRSDPNVSGVGELDESITAKSCFGAIGTGRRINKSREASEWKPVDTPPSPEHVPDILFKCFPSRGVSLHVSPAITSPGGHRDLEIKFFSVAENVKPDSEKVESGYRSDSNELQPVTVQ